MPTKKKPAKKPIKKKKRPKLTAKKPVWTGAPASLWAVKGPSVSKKVGFMPDEVVMCLGGDAPNLLEQYGWGTVAEDEVIDGMSDMWPRDRIEANLARLRLAWAEDYGRGWKLEIR